MKTIARFIFSVYAITMFIIWVLIGALVYLVGLFWLFPQLNKLFIQFLYGVIDRLIMISTMIRTEQYFHGTYSKEQSYVVVSNHQTALDIPVNIYVRPREIIFKFLGKSEAGNIPVLGYLH